MPADGEVAGLEPAQVSEIFCSAAAAASITRRGDHHPAILRGVLPALGHFGPTTKPCWRAASRHLRAQRAACCRWWPSCGRPAIDWACFPTPARSTGCIATGGIRFLRETFRRLRLELPIAWREARRGHFLRRGRAGRRHAGTDLFRRRHCRARGRRPSRGIDAVRTARRGWQFTYRAPGGHLAVMHESARRAGSPCRRGWPPNSDYSIQNTYRLTTFSNSSCRPLVLGGDVALARACTFPATRSRACRPRSRRRCRSSQER